MADMLVRLYDLPEIDKEVHGSDNITFRRPMASEKKKVTEWVERNFSPGWASECDTAFSRVPVSCFIAVEDGNIEGFSCYDTACKNFFGPAGVVETSRGRGVGRRLLLEALYAMRSQGYAYGIIGGVGPSEFYQKTVGAVPIEGSTPGIYETSID